VTASPSAPPVNEALSTLFNADDLAEALSLDGAVMDRLNRFDRLLVETNKTHNLVARSTIETRWYRHFLDSAQLLRFLRADDETILDMGAGAGFPGLILAALSEPDRRFILVESIAKKAKFLTEAANAMGLGNVRVETARVEALTSLPSLDGITTRAMAPLVRLFDYAHPLCASHTRLIFPKGARAEDELTQARKRWQFTCAGEKSMTSADACILIIDQLSSQNTSARSARNTQRRRPKQG